LLDRGCVVQRGSPDDCISTYLSRCEHPAQEAGVGLPFRVTALGIEPKRALRSGDWLSVRIDGDILGPPDVRRRIILRVRNLRSAHQIFVFDVTDCDPRLLVPGPFTVTVELQANMGTGVFSIDVVAWDPLYRKDVWQGPRGLVRVEAPFSGSINLHPRATVAASPAAMEEGSATPHRVVAR